MSIVHHFTVLLVKTGGDWVRKREVMRVVIVRRGTSDRLEESIFTLFDSIYYVNV